MIWFIRVSSPSCGVCLFVRSLNRNHTDEKEKADDEKRLKRKGRFEIKLNIGASVGFILRQFFLELCSTEVKSFVFIESSYSVDFALQFGKAWNRSFVGCEFCNTFVLIIETVVSDCCEKESSTRSIRVFV